MAKTDVVVEGAGIEPASTTSPPMRAVHRPPINPHNNRSLDTGESATRPLYTESWMYTSH